MRVLRQAHRTHLEGLTMPEVELPRVADGYKIQHLVQPVATSLCLELAQQTAMSLREASAQQAATLLWVVSARRVAEMLSAAHRKHL